MSELDITMQPPWTFRSLVAVCTPGQVVRFWVA